MKAGNKVTCDPAPMHSPLRWKQKERQFGRRYYCFASTVVGAGQRAFHRGAVQENQVIQL